jgi:acyl-CoA dehydrogenase
MRAKKTGSSEIRQAVTRLGADVIGRDGLAVEPARPFCKLRNRSSMLRIAPE